MITIYRCVPDNSGCRIVLTHHEKELLSIFNELVEISGKDSIKCSFRDAVKTELEAYP
jgi:hypothetical protein